MRLSQWTHKHKEISQSHLGVCPGRKIEEEMILLDAWIKNKWQESKLVAGLFLDVKSAYPALHKESLLKVLQTKDKLAYLIAIIRFFLTDRSMDIRIDDFTSQIMPLERGLPQGLPLSVTLYLLYSSNLLLADKIKTSSNRLSIGYIDDVTNLLAEKMKEEA
ncbi:hypothetical protein O181_036884 [Austropuccinia psidii MF-1]|uniref:Reverse transcriptase domain-containing protein n=1 Tax=Austropuccinia psidii MF-1 TaxID=1389203 RepID=A0A9Q3HBZ5_9BASI|nr:hypothetical protein [Austropuccinia psidii MF-1]